MSLHKKSHAAENTNEIKNRLNAMTNQEWKTLRNNLEKFVKKRLRGRTKYGAHTIQFLGEDPLEHYIQTSITKIITMERKWDYLNYTLEEQLKRIIVSMMSAKVESFERQNAHFLKEDEITLEFLAYTYAYEEEDLELLNKKEVQYNILNQASYTVLDELEMIIFTLVYKDRLGSKEIAVILSMDKEEVQKIRHNARRRLCRFILNTYNDYEASI